MDKINVEQGSEEWKRLRVGSLGAASMHLVLAKTKTGWGASRANTMADIVVERLTGLPTETYTNSAMEWGKVKEAEARSAYEFYQSVTVETVGLFRHPTIANSHASPDGLVGDDGLVEIKCPQSATHIETLLSQAIPARYIIQMQWQMACTGRKWCDFVSFDPRLPEEMKLWVHRVQRDDGRIAELEKEASIFLAEVDAKVAELRKLYGQNDQ